MCSNRCFFGKIALLFAGVVIVTLARNYNAFVLPALYWEDGTKLFAFYTNHPSPRGILRFYAGYTSLLPNLVGYLATLAPPPISPYIMGAYSLLLTGIAYTIFYLRRFRCVENNDGVRLLVCVLMTLMPLGDFAIMSSAMQSLWHLLWILVLLAYAPLGCSVLGIIVQCVLLGFAVWSHPSSIFVFPLYIYNLIKRPELKDRLFNGGLLLLTILYFCFGIQMAAVPEKNSYAQVLYQSLICLFDKVIFESLCGKHLHLAIHQQGLSQAIFLTVVIILAFLGLLTFQRRAALCRKDWGRMLGVCILIMMLTVIGVMRTDDFILWTPRYTYVQQLLFLSSLVLLLNTIIKWRSWSRISQAGTVVAIVLYLVLINWENTGYFKSDAQEGRRVAEFLRTLDEKNDLPPHMQPATLVLHKKPPKWSIRIQLKPPQPKH